MNSRRRVNSTVRHTSFVMDLILKYLSVITVAGAAISFVIGLIKYLDQRNREERTKRFELFHDLMRRASAFGERADEAVALTQQVAAVYELQHFKDYAYASVPILEHMHAYYAAKESPQVLLNAIERTLEVLR
jgi:hypothetical protein